MQESDGIKAVHEAFKSGINLFDTSPFYGLTKSEEVLGRAIADLPRKEIIVATKVGRYGESEFDFSAGRVTASVDESLKRLQIDYLDIVQCHDIEFGNLEQVLTIEFTLLGSQLVCSVQTRADCPCVCVFFFSLTLRSSCLGP